MYIFSLSVFVPVFLCLFKYVNAIYINIYTHKHVCVCCLYTCLHLLIYAMVEPVATTSRELLALIFMYIYVYIYIYPSFFFFLIHYLSGDAGIGTQAGYEFDGNAERVFEKFFGTNNP